MYFFEKHAVAETEYVYSDFLRIKAFPAHFHRAYELIYLTEGVMPLRVDGKDYMVQTGDLVFMTPNQIHSASSDEYFAGKVLVFSPEIIGDFHSAHQNQVPENNIMLMPDWLDFADLQNSYRMKGNLYLLCDLLLTGTTMQAAANQQKITTLQKLFEYIDNHYSEDCSLKNAATFLQYDYTYLSKLFTKYTGLTFTKYLNNYRISKACHMLNQNEMSVSEIADKCGYANLRTFHRNFKKVTQCAPQSYILTSLGPKQG